MNNNQKNLQLPLLGTLSKSQLHDTLLETIIDEATAADFYANLLNEAHNQLQHEFIEHAREDELKHLDYFTRLYYQYFGQKPQYKINHVPYPNYKEGILIALKDELAAGEFYRDVQLSVKDELIRDIYYMAMVDELEHATQFSTIYNQLQYI